MLNQFVIVGKFDGLISLNEEEKMLFIIDNDNNTIGIKVSFENDILEQLQKGKTTIGIRGKIKEKDILYGEVELVAEKISFLTSSIKEDK